MTTTPRTYALPNGTTVTLPTLTPREHAAAILRRPWREPEAVEMVMAAQGLPGVRGEVLRSVALTRLAMAVEVP